MANKRLKINCNQLIRQAVDDKKLRAAYSQAMRDASVRVEFGRRLVDKILERTAEGMDKDGKQFKGYKKSYIQSLAFEIYKSQGDPVNLRLTGQMLDSLDARAKGSFDVELFFIGAENNKKAEWNIEGTDTMPSRDFLGISIDEQIEILKDTLKDVNDKSFDFDLPNVRDIEDSFVSDDDVPEEG